MENLKRTSPIAMHAIHLSDSLLNELLQWSGVKDREEALQIAIDTYIRFRKRQHLHEMRGRLPLETDLDQLRKE